MKKIQRFFFLLFFLIYFLSCNDQSVPTSSSDPPPLYNEDGLLTDAGLVTEEDPNAPQENENWVEWIKANSIPVRSLDV